MRHIILKSLELVNFKGEASRVTYFKQDVTTISGRNGIGKSRHFDAFVWLLFGRDVNDRKDYEIKTRINGKELHNAECGVTGVLDIDGTTVVLKRRIMEEYTREQGGTEKVFKGNRTACWWNDTPVSVSDYNARIRDIIQPELFRMITNPLYFPTMKWQSQRDLLFRMAGGVSDADILADDKFAALREAAAGRDMTDVQKAMAAKKKELKAKLANIQPRVEQMRSLMPAAEDYEALRAEAAGIMKKIGDVEAAINNKALARQKADGERLAKINELKMKMQDVVFKAQAAAKKQKQENMLAVQTKQTEVQVLYAEIMRLKQEADDAAETINTLNDRCKEIIEEQTMLRDKWVKTNEAEWDGSDICPNCHQRMPQEMIASALETFNAAKQKECDKITDEGKRLGKKIKKNEADIAKLKKAIQKSGDLVADKKAVIAAANDEIKALQSIIITEPDIDAIPEACALQSQINALSAAEQPASGTTELQQEKAALMSQRDAVNERLYKEKQAADISRAIEEVKKEGEETACAIAEIERSEYLFEEFRMAKAKACEAKINSMFHQVTFRLYDFTIAGNPVEVCVPLINGVPFGAANTAARVNAGIDIINTLCFFFGICAPIFIDGRESVLELTKTPSQIINLKVTEDEILKVS